MTMHGVYIRFWPTLQLDQGPERQIFRFLPQQPHHRDTNLPSYTPSYTHATKGSTCHTQTHKTQTQSHIHIHTHNYTCIHTHTRTHTDSHTHTHTHTHTRTHTHTHTWLAGEIHGHHFAQTNKHTRIHQHTHPHSHTRTHTLDTYKRAPAGVVGCAWPAGGRCARPHPAWQPTCAGLRTHRTPPPSRTLHASHTALDNLPIDSKR